MADNSLLEGGAVPCSIFSSIFGTYLPIDASGLLPWFSNQNCLRHNQISSGDKTIPAGKHGDKEFEHNLANCGNALKLFLENIRFALKESREQRGDMGPSKLLQ